MRGADREEVRRAGSEPAPRMQQVDMQRRARPARAGNRLLAHTEGTKERM